MRLLRESAVIPDGHRPGPRTPHATTAVPERYGKQAGQQSSRRRRHSVNEPKAAAAGTIPQRVLKRATSESGPRTHRPRSHSRGLRISPHRSRRAHPEALASRPGQRVGRELFHRRESMRHGGACKRDGLWDLDRPTVLAPRAPLVQLHGGHGDAEGLGCLTLRHAEALAPSSERLWGHRGGRSGRTWTFSGARR
jgi:hypothetical protein